MQVIQEAESGLMIFCNSEHLFMHSLIVSAIIRKLNFITLLLKIGPSKALYDISVLFHPRCHLQIEFLL